MTTATEVRTPHAVWWALCAAFLFRAIYAYLVWTPYFISPDDTMAMMYVRSAYLLANGDGYSQTYPHDSPGRTQTLALVTRAREGERINPFDNDAVSADGVYPETLHPPGWSLCAALLHIATGQPVWIVMQACTILVDVLACYLTFLLVQTFFGDKRVAIVSCWLYALFPPLAYSAVCLRPQGWMSCFVISILFLVALSVTKMGKARWQLYMFAGVLAGASGYFRPDYLLLAPFLTTCTTFMVRSRWQPILGALLIVTVSLAVLSPWAFRNRMVTGHWIFTSSSAGCTLVTGLGAYPNPWGFGPSDLDRAKEAKEQGFDSPFSPEADFYFRRQFIIAVQQHPRAYAEILAKRLIQPIAAPYSCGNRRFGDVSYSELRSEGRVLASLWIIFYSQWPRIVVALVSFLGLGCLCGLLLWRSIRRDVVFLLLMVYFYAVIVHVATHMAPYYLLPAAFVKLVALSFVACTLLGERKPKDVENKEC